MSDKIVVTNNKLLYIYILKCIAILMVLFNHTQAYWGALVDDIGLLFVSKAILAFLCKAGVPIFFMCSGILLLNREESLLHLIKHRIGRIVVVMLIFAAIYTYSDLTIQNYFVALTTSLSWYLYAYLGYLIMLPMLRKIFKNATKKEAFIFICVVAFLYFLDGVTLVNWMNPLRLLMSFLPLYYGAGTHGAWELIYPLIGAFSVSLFSDEQWRKHLLTLLGIGCIVSFTFSVFFSYEDKLLFNGNNAEMLRQDFIVIPSACVLIFVCSFSRCVRNVKIIKMFENIASATFGVFLFETCSEIKNIWRPFKVLVYEQLGTGGYVSGIIGVFIDFSIFVTITLILKKIPIVKRLL